MKAADPSDRRRRERRAARGGRGDRAVLPHWASNDALRRRAAHLPRKPGRRNDGRRAHDHLSLRLDRPPAAGPQISRRGGSPFDRRRLPYSRGGDDESGHRGRRLGDGDRSALVFLANSHVAHDCRIGEGVILSNNVMLAGHCQIGDFANSRRRRRGAPVRSHRRACVRRRTGGRRARPDPVRHCARQPRRARRPQCRRPEAPGLLA